MQWLIRVCDHYLQYIDRDLRRTKEIVNTEVWLILFLFLIIYYNKSVLLRIKSETCVTPPILVHSEVFTLLISFFNGWLSWAVAGPFVRWGCFFYSALVIRGSADYKALLLLTKLTNMLFFCRVGVLGDTKNQIIVDK